MSEATLEGLQAKIEALEASNQGLKSDLVKAKAKAKGAEIDPDAHAQLQADYEALQAKYSVIEKSSAKQTQILTDELNATKKSLSKTKIEANLTATLNEAGVDGKYFKAVKAMFESQAVLDGDVVKIGEKALSEHIKTWATGDEGSPFIAAKQSTGGGAQGGAGAGGGENPYAQNSLNLTKQIELQKTNPALAQQLQAQAKPN